jgi:hypothetical protein
VFPAADPINVPADFSLPFHRPTSRPSRPVVLPPAPQAPFEVRA